MEEGAPVSAPRLRRMLSHRYTWGVGGLFLGLCLPWLAAWLWPRLAPLDPWSTYWALALFSAFVFGGWASREVVPQTGAKRSWVKITISCLLALFSAFAIVHASRRAQRNPTPAPTATPTVNPAPTATPTLTPTAPPTRAPRPISTPSPAPGPTLPQARDAAPGPAVLLQVDEQADRHVGPGLTWFTIKPNWRCCVVVKEDDDRVQFRSTVPTHGEMTVSGSRWTRGGVVSPLVYGNDLHAVSSVCVADTPAVPKDPQCWR